ncbi:DUF932 domain-containing protein [Solimonas soli]|uniref:DUF932 domain-containing protein n=1 Tax=Solimonas soli TaxID=413479 RepID=UPI0004815896|nr:DUF932 domain-containing protein [Solimonas soli]
MAHNLDFTRGTAAMAYAGEVPWHGLGEHLPEGQPIEAWVKAAKLDWELERLPVQYPFEGRLRTLDDRFVLARSDTGDGLSIVSKDYEPVQPRQVLEFYQTLVDRYQYKLETAGALDGGRKIWALARTGYVASVGGAQKDEIAAYLLLATSCDKTLATTAAFTGVRVVCQNTIKMAYRDIHNARRRHVKVPHTVLFDAEEIHQALGLIDQPWEAYLKSVKAMAATPIKPDQASQFFEDLLRSKPDKPLSLPAQREHQTLMSLNKSAPGQNLPTAAGTLWGVVNAVTYYTDHVRRAKSGDRLDSAWFGAGDALKDKAWLAAEQIVGVQG